MENNKQIILVNAMYLLRTLLWKKKSMKLKTWKNIEKEMKMIIRFTSFSKLKKIMKRKLGKMK